MNDDQIASAFGSDAALNLFVSKFFDGSLIKHGMLTLPPVPNEIKPFINEQPPEKQTYSDPNSSKFDPPDISLDGFPT